MAPLTIHLPLLYIQLGIPVSGGRADIKICCGKGWAQSAGVTQQDRHIATLSVHPLSGMDDGRGIGGGTVGVRVLTFQLFLDLADLTGFYSAPSEGFCFFRFQCCLQTRSCTNIYNMIPILLGAHGELLPPFDQEHAGIADLS